MIDTLHVENFRCFRSIELTGLKRVNILVGENASGKTALLESVKLVLEATPNTLPFLAGTRGIGMFVPPNPTGEQFQSAFIDFFNEFDPGRHIELWVRESSRNKTASLSIHFDPGRATTGQSNLGFQPPAPLPAVTIIPLVFERIDFEGQKSSPCATINPQGQLFLEPAKLLGKVSGLIATTYLGGLGENATWLAQLSIEKRLPEVVGALQKHFPFVRGIEAAPGPFGMLTVYVDIAHLPRKVPLSIVSSGMSRLLTFILCLIQYRAGVVCIDEVENGIFYERFPMLWETLLDLSKLYDTQLFVSTHSKECLRASLPVVKKHEDDFMLLRAERVNGNCAVTPVKGSMLESALEQGFDVR